CAAASGAGALNADRLHGRRSRSCGHARACACDRRGRHRGRAREHARALVHALGARGGARASRRRLRAADVARARSRELRRRLARVPLVPSEPDDRVVQEVFARSAAEGRDPIELYRALAHSPKLLRAYSGLATALRYEAETPRALRELVILRTAQLTRSEYEWAHHRKMALAAGVPERQLEELEPWDES